jgi:hypothetical protein
LQSCPIEFGNISSKNPTTTSPYRMVFIMFSLIFPLLKLLAIPASLFAASYCSATVKLLSKLYANCNAMGPELSCKDIRRPLLSRAWMQKYIRMRSRRKVFSSELTFSRKSCLKESFAFH